MSNGSRLRQRTTVLSIASSSSTQTITGFLLAMTRFPSARQPAPPAAAIGDPFDLVEGDQQCAHARKPCLRRLLETCRHDISELGRQWPVWALDRRDRGREV